LCPNCHSLTSTFASKNTHNYSYTLTVPAKNIHKEKISDEHKHCKCGNEKKSLSKICIQCRRNEQRTFSLKNRPSYEVLKDELYKTNRSQVGKKYGVSRNTITKWMLLYEEDLNIPKENRLPSGLISKRKTKICKCGNKKDYKSKQCINCRIYIF